MADQQNFPSILEKLNAWNADILTKDESGNQLSVVSFLLIPLDVVLQVLFYFLFFVRVCVGG